MANYNYLFNTSKALLEKSKSIQGRAYMGHRYGLQEINYDLLGQVLGEVNVLKQYPFVMMAPPHSLFKIGGGKEDGWKNYRMDFFFCDTTYHNTTGGRAYVTNANSRTGISTEPVIDIWDRMDTCAVDFTRVFEGIQRNILPVGIRLLSTQNKFIIPFSEVSMDRVSGVRLSLDIELFVGCELTDYDPIDYGSIQL